MDQLFKFSYAFALNLQTMAPAIFPLLKLLVDPDVEKKLILQLAFRQVKTIGYAKVLAALLGALLVGVSSFIRIPQIKKLVAPKSVDTRVSVANGLSLQSLGLDTFNSLISVVFNQQNKIPFTNYGESLLLGIQNVIIILLVKYYRLTNIKQIENRSIDEKLIYGAKNLLQPAAIIIGVSVFFTKIAPTELINFLQVLNIPINIISKIPQIKNNCKLQSTSHLSDIVIKANVIGGLIRVFTSFQTLKTKKQKGHDINSDLVLLAGYATSFGLSSYVLGQLIVYKKKQTEELEKKQL